MQEVKKIKIDKYDAVNAQLNASIFLFFYDQDHCAIHTLVAAARRLLSDLASHSGILLPTERLIKPEMLAEWRTIMSDAANYLKHADRDSEQFLEFDARLNEFWIIEVIDLWREIGRTPSHQMVVFSIWFSFSYPDLISNRSLVENSLEIYGPKIFPRERSEQMRLFRELLGTQSAA